MRALVLALAGATLGLLLLPAASAPGAGNVCVMEPGDGPCTFVCVPGFLTVASMGAGSTVRADCGSTALSCTATFSDRCWANAGFHTGVGPGVCTASGQSLAVCSSE